MKLVGFDPASAPKFARNGGPMRFAFVPFGLTVVLLGCGRGAAPPSVPPKPFEATEKAGPSSAIAPVAAPVATNSPKPAEPDTLRPLRIATSDPGIAGPSTADHEDLTWKLADGSALKVDSDGIFQPMHEGTATLTAESADGRRFVQPVIVSNAHEPDFSEDIAPILTRHGCNSGACHGRLDGQNGFKLSLFGYAPAEDYRSLTRDASGRRVDTIAPDRSLLLMKATGRVPHGGGQAMPPGAADAARILTWVAQGARFSAKSPRHLTKLRLSTESIERSQPSRLTLHAFAEYDDGTVRDVSAWASWKSLDDRVATVDRFGRVVINEPGETYIVARFGSYVRTSRVVFAGKRLTDEELAPLAGGSFIDAKVAEHLKALGVPPAVAADDATFLRRVTLDLVGRLPEPAEIRRFLKDTAPDKREKLVDSLFADSDFVRFWSLKFGDLLSISTTRQGNAAAFYLLWLQESLSADKPWNLMAKELLTARGTPASRTEAAAAYALENVDPVVAGQAAAQRFLGVRLRCAQCHDHPFDVWTQTQAHQFAAFFAKVRPSAPAPGDSMQRVKIAYFPEGQVIHPLSKSPVSPHVLSGAQPKLAPDTDPLPALAEWMTAPDNPFFAKAFSNWLWAQFFATGLVDPIDDLSASNPPSHPDLLDALAKRFVESGYRVKPMIREIVLSRTYGLSSVSDDRNRLFERFNAFQAPRPLSAQQAADALAQATGVPNRFANKPTGTRAIEIQDPATPSPLLETLGRCDRQAACATTDSSAISLRQSLLWIGSDTVDAKVAAVSGYVRQLLELDPEPDSIVENLYLRTLSRFPSDKETAHWREAISQAGDRAEIVEDLFWALLNTREFQFNH